MTNNSIFGPNVALLEQTARFAELRNEVLAGNIANISTPQYAMRDLPVEEFKHRLEQAMVQPQSSGQASSAQDEVFPQELFQPQVRKPAQGAFHDESNRSIEHEVLELTKNASKHGMAIDLLWAQYQQMEAVISERA